MASGERVAHLVVNQNAKAAKLIAKLVRSRVVAFPPRLDASCEAGVHECLPLCVHQRHRPARRSPAHKGRARRRFSFPYPRRKPSRDDETRVRTDTSSVFSLGTRSCTLVRTLSLVRVGDTSTAVRIAPGRSATQSAFFFYICAISCASAMSSGSTESEVASLRSLWDVCIASCRRNELHMGRGRAGTRLLLLPTPEKLG